MPWEIQRGPDGWLLTKAGNIDQFGSEISFSAASTLGVWVAVNTPGPVATDLISSFSDELYVATPFVNIDSVPLRYILFYYVLLSCTEPHYHLQITK
jgi:hypothetical protein